MTDGQKGLSLGRRALGVSLSHRTMSKLSEKLSIALRRLENNCNVLVSPILCEMSAVRCETLTIRRYRLIVIIACFEAFLEANQKWSSNIEILMPDMPAGPGVVRMYS